jgi:hypothetical protein
VPTIANRFFFRLGLAEMIVGIRPRSKAPAAAFVDEATNSRLVIELSESILKPP